MSVDQRLRHAREKVGLSLRQVAERTGIGQSSLCEYESGKRAPRLSQLQALASLYRRSMSFFLAEGDIPREIVLWRQKPDGESAPEIQATFLRLCEQFHNLEVWCDDHRPCLLPRAEGDPATYRYPGAERLAKQVRSVLELGDRPGQSLLWVLEEVCGVKVFHLPFEPTGSAACTVGESYGPAILLNARAVRWRRNFDLAHELFHILTWSIYRGSTEGDAVTPAEEEEKLATCFAGNLLMPEETVKQAIEARSREGKVAFEDLFDIARQFDVSVEALFWRIKFLFNRSEDETRRDIDRYQSVATMWEAHRERDDPPDRPARFRALALKAFSKGEIAKGVLAEYLGISRQSVMRLVEGGSPADEELALPRA